MLRAIPNGKSAGNAAPSLKIVVSCKEGGARHLIKRVKTFPAGTHRLESRHATEVLAWSPLFDCAAKVIFPLDGRRIPTRPLQHLIGHMEPPVFLFGEVRESRHFPKLRNIVAAGYGLGIYLTSLPLGKSRFDNQFESKAAFAQPPLEKRSSSLSQLPSNRLRIDGFPLFHDPKAVSDISRIVSLAPEVEWRLPGHFIRIEYFGHATPYTAPHLSQ
ncbi:hypothetical protein SJA_C1-10010 [Sphingobium indicum UT26S]|uniref:Uncharacterized protein n=1 Tax=Sphingobium indicum (strain DSM 16413 / CCM 7287 / MTCC 6362 / UT26 / NBRC 101211 / UT26S) TaxID=452662 RepID=D4YZQ3_SPHIU|nr:hypothetical protein SJA_C1-10010 [Sphingobium indicum UT26S]